MAWQISVFLRYFQHIYQTWKKPSITPVNQVQRFFTEKDRMCDSKYKMDATTKDDYQCTNVETSMVRRGLDVN